MSANKIMEGKFSMTTEMPAAKHGEEVWYRNPWVWLIIAIPSLTVIGCMITIYLALSNPDHLVRDTPKEGGTPTSQSR